MVTVRETALSLDDLLELGDARIEILDGKVVEISSGGISHHIIVSNIYDAIRAYLQNRPDFGLLLSDGVIFLMFSDKNRLRDSFVPDRTFVRAENFLPMEDLKKPYPSVPDLAVEVVSPGDDPDDIAQKVRSYLDKGTSQVWVVYQEAREVYQYRSSEPDNARLYSGSQAIDAGPLLPDLTLPLDDVFELPQWLELQRRGGTKSPDDS